MRKWLKAVAGVLLAAGANTAFGQARQVFIEAYQLFVNGEAGPLLPPTALYELRVLELDLVRLDVYVRLEAEGGQQSQEPQQVALYYEKLSRWVMAYGPPPGPAVPLDTAENEFLTAPLLERLGPWYYRIRLLYRVPMLNGPNQARLRGEIDFDALYDVRVRVWAQSSPSENDPVPGFLFLMYVSQNPALLPANPPPFADAGASVTVAAGSTVTLNAGRTFDASNVGFDITDPNVFFKDRLRYSWEWVSGPQRVDPVSDSQYPWLARVRLDVVGTYRYRVFVYDGANSQPSTADVTIEVVPSLPTNHPPRAVISGPTEPVVVGSVITLDASDSTDPDGDELHYRWKQTDEVGGELPAEELTSMFQPLGGLESVRSRWQAVRPGTFYFLLIVDDGELFATARTTVEVVSALTAGETATSASNAELAGAEESAGGSDRGSAGACGGSFLPLVLVPAGVRLMRGRIR
jgi:hypothetical protein